MNEEQFLDEFYRSWAVDMFEGMEPQDRTLEGLLVIRLNEEMDESNLEWTEEIRKAIMRREAARPENIAKREREADLEKQRQEYLDDTGFLPGK